MLPTMRDRPAPLRHEGLLAASARHRQTAMSTWARAALDRSAKLLTLCAPVDADIAGWAGSGLTALTPDDLHTTAAPVELLQRALPDGDHGLGILIWADAVMTGLVQIFPSMMCLLSESGNDQVRCKASAVS